MSTYEKLKELSIKADKISEQIVTEEGTKNALIMPFLSALEYDVFNPHEVVPEFIADVGVKKGEKVDYAIKKDGKIIIIVECKSVGSALTIESVSQIFRYFSVTDARFAVLTDGIEYLFYSDIDAPNKMDAHPFFEFNLLRFDKHHVEELENFSKAKFSLSNILEAATALKHLKDCKKALEAELSNTSEEFIKYFIGRLGSRRATQQTLNEFSPIATKAYKQFINEKINERLRSAMAPVQEKVLTQEIDSEDSNDDKGEDDDNGVVTTVEEIEGYHIVRAILREVVDVSRIVMRDTKSYCGVLLDDNNRRPICRLHFNYSQKYIGLFDKNKEETRHPIGSLDDIYKFADNLLETVHYY